MYELSWEKVNFSKESLLENEEKLSNENKNYIIEAYFPVATAILILGGLIVVAVAGVKMYQLYLQDKQIQAALQMAKNQNRQIDITTDNRFSMTLNVNHKSSLSIAGESADITRITVYPKGYHSERIIRPNGTILTPYSLN